MTTITELKATPSFVASEIHSVRSGFNVLRRLIFDLRETEGDITDEMVNRLIWTADHVRDELNAAYERVERLVDGERAAVAARRSAVVLQAAE